jgi:SAM-dependent methyltransferase
MGWITRHVPAPIVGVIRTVMRTVRREPQVGSVDFGDLRRTRPVAADYGSGRGGEVDRFYIERFLASHHGDIRGRVLEIGDDAYTRRFGGAAVQQGDILHMSDRNRRATIVADLASAPHIPDATFDCIILTQTLQYIFRPDAAVATLHRILRPGGVLLLTVPGITHSTTCHEWSPAWYWSFTTLSVSRLLAERFGEDVECGAVGNVLSATALLHGLSAVELSSDELAHSDPTYPVIVTARAVRAGAAPGSTDDVGADVRGAGAGASS